jgi:hypothetical protein
MKRISGYEGVLLNHLEAIYRPGDRELAVELVEALGLVATEITFTKSSNPLIAIHPNADDPDSTNNVIFLYEMSPTQVQFEDLMQKKIAGDPELRDAMKSYRERARKIPASIPHFGLRYPSADALDPVVGRLQNNRSPALRERVAVVEMPAYEPIEGLPNIKQVFVYTDVFAAGPTTYGQAIELQVERGR